MARGINPAYHPVVVTVTASDGFQYDSCYRTTEALEALRVLLPDVWCLIVKAGGQDCPATRRIHDILLAWGDQGAEYLDKHLDAEQVAHWGQPLPTYSVVLERASFDRYMERVMATMPRQITDPAESPTVDLIDAAWAVGENWEHGDLAEAVRDLLTVADDLAEQIGYLKDAERDENTAADACVCDNTHKQNDTVCRWCWNHGRRHWNDPDVDEDTATDEAEQAQAQWEGYRAAQPFSEGRANDAD